MGGQDHDSDSEFVVTHLNSIRHKDALVKTPGDQSVTDHRGNRRSTDEFRSNRQADGSIKQTRSNCRVNGRSANRQEERKTSDALAINEHRGDQRVKDRQAIDRREIQTQGDRNVRRGPNNEHDAQTQDRGTSFS
jgi:hypothetical protein